MRILASILIVMLLIQNKVYSEELEVEIITIPERLVSNTDAMLVIKYKDLPFTPDIEAIISANKTVAVVNDDSLRKIGNNLIVDLKLLKGGETSITVIPKSGKPVSKTITVYESSNVPTTISMKIVPSTFSYLGPSTGYITIQLLNAEGMPIKADKDYKIDLTTTNDILTLNNITIKEGDYYAIKQFNIKGYGESIIKAKLNNLVAEKKVSVIGPDDKISLKLYIAPEIAPAMRGQKVYAFVQLQDDNGNLLYAKDDMKIDIKSSTDDIITSPAIIKTGENIGIAELIINTDKSCSELNIDLSSRNDFSPCIELYAIHDRLKSESEYLELREYITDDYIQLSNSIDDPKPKLIPLLFPSDMPIIADGKETIIGVLQLMSKTNDQLDLATSKPIVPTHSISIYNSKEELIDVRDITIKKPYSTALVKAKVGYLAGDASVELFGDRLDSSIINVKLYGHESVKMVAEPLIDKILKNTYFPYLIYFEDEQGAVAYAIEDLNPLISMDNDIVTIESKHIKKGSSGALLEAFALDVGDTTITFEAIASDKIQTSSKISILEQKGNNIGLTIPDMLVKNSKELASIYIFDSMGFPIATNNDLNAYIYTSNKLLNIPKVVTIPQGKYFAVFPIESLNGTGKVEVRIFIDGYEPLSKSIEIVDDYIHLSLEPDKEPIVDEQLTLTLKALYKDQPLSNANVRWENNKGLPIEYDTITDNEGSAKAKYLITEEGEYTFGAKVDYKGLERSIKLILNTKNNTKNVDNNSSNITNNTNNTVESEQKTEEIDLPINIEYLLIIPAIASIAFSILKKRSSK